MSVPSSTEFDALDTWQLRVARAGDAIAALPSELEQITDGLAPGPSLERTLAESLRSQIGLLDHLFTTELDPASAPPQPSADAAACGRRLRGLRAEFRRATEHRLTYARLCTHMGDSVDDDTVGRWFRGEQLPHPTNATQLAETFTLLLGRTITANYILTGSDS
jgi:hypothetical protein